MTARIMDGLYTKRGNHKVGYVSQTLCAENESDLKEEVMAMLPRYSDKAKVEVTEYDYSAPTTHCPLCNAVQVGVDMTSTSMKRCRVCGREYGQRTAVKSNTLMWAGEMQAAAA